MSPGKHTYPLKMLFIAVFKITVNARLAASGILDHFSMLCLVLGGKVFGSSGLVFPDIRLTEC